MKNIRYIILIHLVFGCIQLNAQCKVENKFFSAGEELSYDMYFKYGLINTKAGKSLMTVSEENFDGKEALKMHLIGNTKGVANKLFSLSDTLSCVMTKELVPLAYQKNAHESGDHTIEKATYSYANNKITIKTNRIRNDELRFDEELTSGSCIYDMLSVVYYARTLDYSTMMKGDKVSISFLSGKRIASMDIEDHGIEVVNANDNRKYDCIKLVLVINAEAFDDKKEAMTVYITNDYNRIPIRIDSKLKIGSTRAILKSYKGNLYPVKSVN